MKTVHGQLRHTINIYSSKFTTDPELCAAFLSSELSEFHLENKILLQAVRAKIPNQILFDSSKTPNTELKKKQLTFFESESDWKWAVDTWHYGLTGRYPLFSQKGRIGQYRIFLSIVGIGGLLLFAYSYQRNQPSSFVSQSLVHNTSMQIKRPFTESNSPPDVEDFLRNIELQEKEKLTIEVTQTDMQQAIDHSFAFSDTKVLLDRRTKALKALDSLYQTTHDTFYTLLIKQTKANLSEENKKLRQTSAQYAEKILELCQLPPKLASESLRDFVANHHKQFESIPFTKFLQHIQLCIDKDGQSFKAAQFSLLNNNFHRLPWNQQ